MNVPTVILKMCILIRLLANKLRIVRLIPMANVLNYLGRIFYVRILRVMFRVTVKDY